jgi:hypothetical protein
LPGGSPRNGAWLAAWPLISIRCRLSFRFHSDAFGHPARREIRDGAKPR